MVKEEGLCLLKAQRYMAACNNVAINRDNKN